MNNAPFRFVGENAETIATVVFLSAALVHIAFAFGVWISARTRAGKNGGGVYFVPPFVWSLATLMGGVFVATAYWIIHISELNPGSRVTSDAT